MQTKDFPSVIAVKKSTQPLIEQYKNMMDTEQAAPFIPITAADVTDEPVAHMYPWDLERFATNETTAHAYSVAVGCSDGVSVPLYTHPPATFTPITADDVTDEMVEAYLTAQRATVEEADRMWGRPNAGGLHTNTVRGACRIGLTAAVNAYIGSKK